VESGVPSLLPLGHIQDRPLMRNPQINRFQMLIRNLRGLDFGFDGLPPTARGCFQD
jgi:hypothetical protein